MARSATQRSVCVLALAFLASRDPKRLRVIGKDLRRGTVGERAKKTGFKAEGRSQASADNNKKQQRE